MERGRASRPSSAAALARAIAGRAPGTPLTDQLLDAAIDAGVAPLVAARLGRGWPSPAQRERIERARRDAAALAALLDAALVRATRTLADAGVESLAFKGSHLAHALYAAPDLRPRADVDLLVRSADRARASAALQAAGFRPSIHVRGSVILGQWHFDHPTATGASVPIDLHWRPFAPLVLSGAIDTDAVLAAAGSITVDGRVIRVPSPVHALTFAVVHLAAHHATSLDLLWLNDVRLLAEALEDGERDAFVQDARERRYCRVAASAVSAAGEIFEDDGLLDLARTVSSGVRGVEPSAALLSPRRTPFRDLWLDLRVAGWRDRVRLLREHTLPSPEYMRGTGERGWLPLSYTRRAVRGVSRWRERPARHRG